MEKISTTPRQKRPGMAPKTAPKPLRLAHRFKGAHLNNTTAARLELAKQLGVSVSTLQRYMEHDCMPLQVFIKMADALRMSREELLDASKPIRTVQMSMFAPGQTSLT